MLAEWTIAYVLRQTKFHCWFNWQICSSFSSDTSGTKFSSGKFLIRLPPFFPRRQWREYLGWALSKEDLKHSFIEVCKHSWLVVHLWPNCYYWQVGANEKIDRRRSITVIFFLKMFNIESLLFFLPPSQPFLSPCLLPGRCVNEFVEMRTWYEEAE